MSQPQLAIDLDKTDGLNGSRFELDYETTERGLERLVTTSIGTFRSVKPLIGIDGRLDDAWWLDFLRGGAEYPTGRRGSIGVIDLFCGSGGLSLGASTAATALGYKVAHEFAADANPQALGIYGTNHRPRVAANESVAELVSYRIQTKGGRASFAHEPQIINAPLGRMIGHADLLLAGPPCQGHSTYNNKTRFNDPRNLLYLTVPAIAVAMDIPALIIENVQGVTASREGVVKTTVDLLESSGYSVTSHVLRSDTLGWPQTRKRFFLVATKGWEPIPLAMVSEVLSRESRPVSWLLDDILDTAERSVMTEEPETSAENRRRIDFLHDNNLFDLPNTERPECHQNGTTYKAVYGRMHWDRPAQTITTGFMTAGRGRHVHPLRRRTLLPREAARIQGFPDNYLFEMAAESLGRTAIAKGIGDAVPSILGFAAALSALGNRPN